MLFTLKQTYSVFKIFVQIVDTENNQLNFIQRKTSKKQLICHRSHFVFAKRNCKISCWYVMIQFKFLKFKQFLICTFFVNQPNVSSRSYFEISLMDIKSNSILLGQILHYNPSLTYLLQTDKDILNQDRDVRFW